MVKKIQNSNVPSKILGTGKLQIIVLGSIILILLIIGLTYSNKPSKAIQTGDSSNVTVIDSKGLAPNNQSTSSSSQSIDNNLGPATVQDLGGNSGATNIDELLKDKQIEVGK